MRQVRIWNVASAGAAYCLIGIATAALARRGSSPIVAREWRLAAWLLSFAVLAVHFFVERGRRERPATVATQVGLGVALGALALAAFGPVRAHWGEPSALRLAVLSLVAWPILVGVPAFLATLLCGLLVDRAASRTAE